VWRLPVTDPRRAERVADLGVGPTTGLDDLAVAADGTLFVAANLSGEVLRVDPASGHRCVVADGICQPAAVAVEAGPDGSPEVLWVTSLTGRLHRIEPA
jgi:streptogramin lyase